MDLKLPENKQHLEVKIKDLLKDYDDLFSQLCTDATTYKKSALLYYWLRDYKNYVKNESNFSPLYYPDFTRGNIVNINFGFNLGSELGGLHYGVVLYDSPKKNPNLTIIPLISSKPTYKPRHTELDLGNELYHKIEGKYQALRVSIPNEIELIRKEVINNRNDGSLSRKSNDILNRISDLEKKRDLMSNTFKKLQSLKTGSIAVMNQIKTVSKARIETPTNQYDILFNLKLSTGLLDQIDDKIISLFTKKQLTARQK